jgi:hypothetical protein
MRKESVRGTMKRPDKGKGRSRSKKSSSVPKQALKRVDLGVLRERITNLVGNRAVKMVEITMAEVNKGHYLAMKYLFEMIGLCPATAPEGAPEDDSLAQTLLRRLQLPEELHPGTEVTKDCVVDPVEQESDAVK